jgi:phage-related minor tail protein
MRDVRRGQEKETMKGSWNEARSSYRDTVSQGKSVVSETLGSLKNGAEKVVEGLGKMFDDLFKS